MSNSEIWMCSDGHEPIPVFAGHQCTRYHEPDQPEQEFGDVFDGQVAVAPVRQSRRVDLKPFLDGTYQPPQPDTGGVRDDNRQLLYPKRWHTLIAPTTSGKSWWAIWHVVAELRRGNTVVYAHFEEADPGGTLDRIRSVAPELSIDDLVERFVWLDCTRRWMGPPDFAAELPERGVLVILDGINAACAQHGWPVDKPEAVGSYRAHFAAPVIARGGTPVSLGHPPKARDRQDERHGYGSTAWLDEVDGVGFRLKPSDKNPIRRGRHGWSNLYVVKDRYGQVEQHCSLDEKGTSEGWFYAGALHVDSSGESNTVVYSSSPALTDEGAVKGPIEKLADKALQVIVWEMQSRFPSASQLHHALRALEVSFRKTDLDSALTRLDMQKLISWPETAERQARPGIATDAGMALAEKLGRLEAGKKRDPEEVSSGG